jgi:MFS family permease
MARSQTPWRLVALAVTIIVVSTQPVFLLGAAFLDIGPEFGFGTTGLGALTALFFLTASVSSAPLGKVVQRIGWQQAMRINATVSGTLLVVFAVGARNLGAFAALMVASGVVYGLANPAANQALADHVDPRHRALMFGLKHAGIPSSTLLAGLAIPIIIVRFGWRTSYALAAVVAIVVWALIPGGSASRTAQPRGESDPRRFVPPMGSPLLIGLAVGAALATWAAIALSTYLVAAAVDKGLSEVEAGWLLFAGSAASIGGRVAAGHVTDRLGGRGFAAIVTLTATGVIFFALLSAATGIVFAGLVLVAFATGWGWPGLMTYTVVNANSGSAAASSGITQAGVFFGAGVGPIVLGWVAETWSFDMVWLVVAAALGLAAVTVAFVGRIAVARGPVIN